METDLTAKSNTFTRAAFLSILQLQHQTSSLVASLLTEPDERTVLTTSQQFPEDVEFYFLFFNFW